MVRLPLRGAVLPHPLGYLPRLLSPARKYTKQHTSCLVTTAIHDANGDGVVLYACSCGCRSLDPQILLTLSICFHPQIHIRAEACLHRGWGMIPTVPRSETGHLAACCHQITTAVRAKRRARRETVDSGKAIPQFCLDRMGIGIPRQHRNPTRLHHSLRRMISCAFIDQAG